MTLVLGIDPGLAETGIVLVLDEGTSLPWLLHRATLRRWPNPDYPVDSHGRDDVDLMVHAVKAFIAEHPNQLPGLCALETFGHRGYLTTSDGTRRRIPTGPDMGRLVGMLHVTLADLLKIDTLLVSPEDTKRGWPSTERVRAPLLPRALKNRHERDAFLAASYGATIARRRPGRSGA